MAQVTNEAAIPTLLCQSCGTLLDPQARCPSCFGGRTAADVLALEIVLESEYGPMGTDERIAYLRSMGQPHYERAAAALERAARERDVARKWIEAVA